MLPFAETYGAWLLATFLPAVAGISLLVLLGGLAKPRYSAALGLGIFFWFFVDTVQGSSNLQVNAGLGGGAGQVAMLSLFALGVLVFLGADRHLLSGSVEEASMLVPLLVAVALGIHGFGEGSAFGSTASRTSGQSLLAAFGGVSEGAAYALHKVLEPMMVAAVYLPYSKSTAKTIAVQAKDVLALSLAFVLPSLVGGAVGYSASYDSTYFFALGAGTSLYAALRLGAQVFSGPPTPSTSESLRVGFFLVLGFLLIYLAALMHS